MAEPLTPRQQRAALEGLVGNQAFSVHDRLQIAKQVISSYQEEVTLLQARIAELMEGDEALGREGEE